MSTPTTAARRTVTLWHHHPGVRTGQQLTAGERAADHMRNSMGSWAFVFAAIAFLAVWMTGNTLWAHAHGHTFDPYPYILLNLVLSCVAALQGAILLIAAKRSDQISSELAQHDFEQDTASRQMLETLTTNFAQLQAQHAEQGRQLTAALTKLDQLTTTPNTASNSTP